MAEEREAGLTFHRVGAIDILREFPGLVLLSYTGPEGFDIAEVRASGLECRGCMTIAHYERGSVGLHMLWPVTCTLRDGTLVCRPPRMGFAPQRLNGLGRG